MKHNVTLGCIAAMLAVGVFYTFALCMVQDIDEIAVSEEQYTVTEAAPQTAEKKTDKAVKTDSKATETALKAEAAGLPALNEGFVFNTAVSSVSAFAANTVNAPEKDTEDTDKLPPEKEENAEDVPQEAPETDAAETAVTAVEEEDDGSIAEASEKPVYAANAEADEDHSIFEAESIEDAENASETEAPETYEVPETAPPEASETEAPEDDTYLFDEDDTIFDDITDYYPETSIGTSETDETPETSVSVNMNIGADISTSETFTAKINGSAQTVNAYDLICQIVANEMSPSFSDEALKAQAVAAYSYVKYHNVNGLTPTVLVKRDVPDKIKNIVSQVWGVCCYYNGSVAQTVYMASSSGYTADAANVWGGSVPYLKSVYCPFDIDSDPNYGDTKQVSESSMRNMLESCLGITLSDNPYNWLVITGYEDGNYVSEISVDGQKTISGRKLRENVMGHGLKSAAFDVYYSDGYFHFTTYGYGHGVGMSQNGANILAKQGYSYIDILKYYFTGIEVQ